VNGWWSGQFLESIVVNTFAATINTQRERMEFLFSWMLVFCCHYDGEGCNKMRSFKD